MTSYLPSPTQGVLWIGPLPLRAYALCILVGIFVAVWIAGRRLIPRGGTPDDVYTVAWWAVPFGIVGGRVYHLITSPQAYFGEGGHPLNAFAIWHGGLGIWGAVALGALGGWIGSRKAGISFLDFADAAVPGVLVAQAIGRWGNWFNNELYGGRTDLPWKLQIHEWDESRGHAVVQNGHAVVLGYYQPTFLYEAIWCLLIAAVILVLDRRLLLGRGRVLGLYVMLYPVGRIVFELMRTDPANHILGLRVNVWVCILVFLGGLALFLWTGRNHPDGVREGLAERHEDAGATDDERSDDTATAESVSTDETDTSTL
ncbi:prolipoprotein diacylglyceryl transferase [Allobranchiibius sp. GilTou38]|uniref:prolipoprotein diacylglyceryl transferase n=1 Tax=Allobranchiibius sp. GilTou38 TaxID=2815210 RepID=UPI001AA0BE94|nr:prolipoprotein diacylglyceryl transferase [Allobranchiibius sp. GilTou38]MBO1766289.1 prolipoprotein diacylglyceryl transferase [Allobranchiibius sp. GilTou38]